MSGRRASRSVWSRRMEPRDVGVVFVNFHCAASIARRVRTVVDAGLAHVVVDNSGEYEGPGTVVRPGRNLGFGVGCNEGVRHLPPQCRIICLHNPDVDADPADILGLADRLTGMGRPGAIAPALRTPQGVVRGGYHAPQLLREIAIVGRRALRRGQPSTTAASHDRSPRRPPTTPGFRFGSGALLLVSRRAFEHVGGFDPRFPLYAEDLDLWQRLHSAGFEMAFDDDVVVEHDKVAGSPTSSGARARLRDAGVELFVQLHRGRRWRLYRAVHRVGGRAASAVPSEPIESLIETAWSDGSVPLVVAERITTAFADGAMEPVARSVERSPLPREAVGALIVTQNPDLENLRRLAETIVTSGVELWISDNASGSQPEVSQIAETVGAVAFSHDANAGISERLNEALHSRPAVQWLLYLDQDSRLLPEQLDRLLSAAAAADPDVAMISPQYVQMSTGHLGYSRRHLGRALRTPIGSGTVYRSEACREVGGFDERLPLDLGDLEMALRLQARGHSVQVVESVVVGHAVGDRGSATIRIAAGERHPPWRYYLKWRALVIVSRRFGRRFPGWVGRHIVGRTIETLRSAVSTRDPAILGESLRGLLGGHSSRVPADLLARARSSSSLDEGQRGHPT